MPRRYEELDDARATREETLSLADGLTQEQADWRPTDDDWSAGEILDHLVRTDDLYLDELEVLVERKRRGKLPFLYRGAGRFVTVPWPVRPFMPFFELPFAFVNSTVPAPLRRAFFGSRQVPAKSPEVLRPRRGRPVEELRHDLHRLIDTLDRYTEEDFDLRRLVYYNPVLGLANVPSAVRFMARHERRHQGQLRDVLASVAFPEAA